MLIALMAGAAAERRMFGYHEPGTDSGDLEIARGELARVFNLPPSHPEIGAWLEDVRTDAAAEVETHQWIQRTAVALRRARALDQRQIEVCRPEPTAPRPDTKGTTP